MWKRTENTAMAATLTLLALALLLFSVMAIESIKATESVEKKRPSEHHKVNVSIRELLSLVGQSATIPPHVPVNKSCEPEDLPRWQRKMMKVESDIFKLAYILLLKFIKFLSGYQHVQVILDSLEKGLTYREKSFSSFYLALKWTFWK